MDHNERGDLIYFHAQAEAIAPERFAFLVEERGFTPGPIKRSARATSFYYVRTPELGLEVELSYEDMDIYAYMVRLRAGNPPRQLGTHTNNDTCIRMHIQYLLQRVLGVQDPWLEEVIRRWQAAQGWALSNGYRFADMRLTDLSDIVKRYLDLILEQPMEVLFPPARDSDIGG